MPFSARSFSKAARATNEQRRQFPANSVTVSETNAVPAIPEVDCYSNCRTADFEKLSRDGNYVLRAKRLGKFWAPERSIKITSGRYTYRSIEALVFAFGEIPIWTRTHQAAMRLAEHCDPIPASPVAGFWRPMFTAT